MCHNLHKLNHSREQSHFLLDYKKDILVNSLKDFDEIILIGSGKGVASVKNINQIKWKRKNLKFYNILSRHYKSAVSKCKRYS